MQAQFRDMSGLKWLANKIILLDFFIRLYKFLCIAHSTKLLLSLLHSGCTWINCYFSQYLKLCSYWPIFLVPLTKSLSLYLSIRIRSERLGWKPSSSEVEEQLTNLPFSLASPKEKTSFCLTNQKWLSDSKSFPTPSCVSICLPDPYNSRWLPFC